MWQNLGWLTTSQIPNLLQRSHGTGGQTSQEQAAADSAQNDKNLNLQHVLNEGPPCPLFMSNAAKRLCEDATSSEEDTASEMPCRMTTDQRETPSLW